jgi:miniconductance mechanosensitive channel
MTQWMHDLLKNIQLKINIPIEAIQLFLGIILLFVTWTIYKVVRHLFIVGLTHLIKKSKNHWANVFLEHKVLNPIPILVPITILQIASSWVIADPALNRLVHKILIAIAVFACLQITSRTVDALMTLGKQVPILRYKPLTSYAQVFKIILYVISIVIVLSTFLGKSPWLLLSGLGALTAVLLIVFKEPILGFTASLQLSSNDMIRPGDWIEMAKYGADGDVLDVSLTTIKVQNFDKTITTIPNYALIADSFKNWRGMRESGGRRIKRSIKIDMTSIQFCTPEMLDHFEKIERLKDYLGEKRAAIAKENQNSQDLSVSINGRRLTNIGTFRAYVKAYLWNHPKIRRDMTFIIRQLDPSPEGLPLEICVFISDQDFVPYEETQADIFDHLMAALPEFGLKIFQDPTGADFKRS